MEPWQQLSTEVPERLIVNMRDAVARGAYESMDELVYFALCDRAEFHASEKNEPELIRAKVRLADKSGPSIPAEQVLRR